jgi:alkaline phosphatase
MATGYQHSENGIISMDAAARPRATILELARQRGMRTGIITTDRISGATPGAFGAHEPDRDLAQEIMWDYIVGDRDHPASRPDLLMGGGYATDFVAAAMGVGYVVVSTASQLQALSSAQLVGDRVLGLFSSGKLQRENDRLARCTEPRLRERTAMALEILNESPSGFFLVVESALIDKLSHANASDDLGPEVEQFHLTVEEVLRWRAQQAIPEDTLVLVTADHETGGLRVAEPVSGEAELTHALSWSSTGHTTARVLLYST